MSKLNFRPIRPCKAFLCLVALFNAAPSLAASQYRLVDLGTLGGPVSDAYAVNNGGIVGGTSWTSANGGDRPFLSAPNPTGPGQIYSIGSLFDAPGLASVRDIGDDGRAVGFSGPHAFITTSFPDGPGHMVDIGTLGGGSSEARAINSQGRVVGTAAIDEQHTFAFISAPNPTGPGQLTNLGALGDGQGSAAFDINASNRVVGTSHYVPSNGDSPGSRAFISLPDPTGGGQLIDLGTMLGDEDSSFAYGINDNGQVVGAARSVSGETHAFISQPNPTGIGQLIDIGVNEFDSGAYGINSEGVVVGWMDTGETTHAFVSDPSPTGQGHIYDLNSLLIENVFAFVLSEATAVNDNGQIVGWGFVQSRRHAFLLNPVTVPLPVSLVLFMAGVVPLALRSRRSKCDKLIAASAARSPHHRDGHHP